MCTTYQVTVQRRAAPWPKDKWKNEKQFELPGEAARVCGCGLFDYEIDPDNREWNEKEADTQAQVLVSLVEVISNLEMNQRIVIEMF